MAKTTKKVKAPKGSELKLETKAQVKKAHQRPNNGNLNKKPTALATQGIGYYGRQAKNDKTMDKVWQAVTASRAGKKKK